MSTRRSSRITKKRQSGAKTVTTGPIEKYLVASGSSKRKQSWLTPPDQEEQMLTDHNSKRQQYEIQNQWRPITSCEQISTRTLVPSTNPSTQVPCHEAMLAAGASCYTFKNIFMSQYTRCPLPPLKWAQPQEVWSAMRNKEKKYVRDKDLLLRHSQLQYRMRAILLDWIIEVCEVYRLHRETFYLTVEFVDRFLSKTEDIQKYQLQLIGVTALFMAAKLEEIYPPKIGEFAYVTDGACIEDDIRKQELIMLKTLHWNLCPMTINTWMSLYLNILNHTSDKSCLTELLFSADMFLIIARLMDLCTLDEGSLQFSTSVLAASILYHFADESKATAASGYHFSELEECINWVTPFAVTSREHPPDVVKKSLNHVEEDDLHNIQTHGADISLLDKAKARQKLMALPTSRASPELSLTVALDVLTPPPTTHKHSTTDQSSGLAGAANSSHPSSKGGSTKTKSYSRTSSSGELVDSTFTAADDILNDLFRADEVLPIEDFTVHQ